MYTDGGGSVNWHTCFCKVNLSCGNNEVQKVFFSRVSSAVLCIVVKIGNSLSVHK